MKPTSSRWPRGIWAVAAVLLLTLVLGHQVDQAAQRLHADQLRIRLGLERLLSLNESLVHTVEAVVLSRNPLRGASYDTLRSELDATMAEVLSLTQAMRVAPDVVALNDEQQGLRAMELKVLEHARADEWAEAQQILRSNDHMMAIKLYGIDSESVAGALNLEMATEAARHERWRSWTLWLRLGLGVALLWLGVWYGRQLNRELHAQIQLQDELKAAGLALEAKVQARTAELEEANHLLRTLSATDVLTGLANRRQFDWQWAQEWQRACRNGSSLAVVMLDVDGFKAYNDHHGHLQGDACLRRLGEVLQREVRRSGELAARYGGEEFVVILPGVGAIQALERAEAVRTSVEAEAMPHAASPVGSVVTVSAGVAVVQPRPGQDPLRAIANADWGLYQAKAQGRNRVVLAPASDEPDAAGA